MPLILLLLFLAPLAAYPAVITVNTLSDESAAGDGQCSLREAITNVVRGSDLSKGDCAAGSGNDVIIFSMTGKITLKSTLVINFNRSLTIIGPESKPGVVIDGDRKVQVMSISGAAEIRRHAREGTMAQSNRARNRLE